MKLWVARDPELFRINDLQLAPLLNMNDLRGQLLYWNNQPGICLVYARLAELKAANSITAIRKFFETPVSGVIAGSVEGVQSLWRMAVAAGVEATASVMLPEGQWVPLAEHPFLRDHEQESGLTAALAEDLAVLEPSMPAQPVERLYAILRLLFDEGPKHEFTELVDAFVKARASGAMLPLDLRKWPAEQVDQPLAEAFAHWDHLGGVSVLAGLTMKLPPGKLEAVLLGKGFSAGQAKQFAALGDLLGELDGDEVAYVFETSLGEDKKVDFDDLQMRLALLAFPEQGGSLESILDLGPADRFLSALASRLSQWPVPARAVAKVRSFLSTKLTDGELSPEQVKALLPPSIIGALEKKVRGQLLRAVATVANAPEEKRPKALEKLVEVLIAGATTASQAELISSALAGLYQADLTRVAPLGEAEEPASVRASTPR